MYWSRSIPTARGVTDLALDADGRIVIVGDTKTPSIDFGAGPLNLQGEPILWVAKLDGEGAHLWSRGFPYEGQSSEAAFFADVAIDETGNILLAGTFTNALDFGGGPLTSAGDRDVFIVKLDPNGEHLWSYRFGDAYEQWARALAMGDDGTFVLAGNYTGNLDFGGGPLPLAPVGALFVARFDSAGEHVASWRFGGPGTDARAIDADTGGNVVAAGDFDVELDLGSTSLDTGQPEYSSDAYVARFDGGGTCHWGAGAGDENRQSARAVVADDEHNVIVAGDFQGAMDFGGATLTSAGDYDVFVATFDSMGNPLWSHRIGTSDVESLEEAAIAPAGKLILTGRVGAWADDPSMWMRAYDATGTLLWWRDYDAPGAQWWGGLDVDSEGSIYVTGSFDKTIDLGLGPLVATDDGYKDLFVAKLPLTQ